MESTLLGSLARPLWRTLDDKGIDADALFEQMGLDTALLADPRARFPYESLCRVWLEASVILENDNIGLEVASYFSPLDMNALGVTFLSSANLVEAMNRLDRYESLLNSRLDFTVMEHRDSIELQAEVEGLLAEAAHVIEDTRTTAILILARIALGDELAPAKVAFTYEQPADTSAHEKLFNCPLAFSQPISSIFFHNEDAHQPFGNANRELAMCNDRFLDEMLGELGETDLVTKVKRAILESLPSGAPSEEDIAARIFVSSRTLQRRLADDGSSFRQLVSDVRQELAVKYISDEKVPLAEISYMLGFADTSSFSRAFKRWTGKPPATYRDNLAA